MLVEMKSIVMDFGPVRAVDHVDIAIEPGSIVGLLGENGAGKSTLMNILAGTYPPVEGEILIDGKKVSVTNARVAGQLGIRFIHQELNLCNDLKVFENMFLGEELKTPFGLLNKKEMIKRCRDVFERMHVNIDPETLLGNLQAAEKQLVEIAKALLFKSELIIMDEPSTALNTTETSNLFEIMRELRKQGVSFIYISHKMPELFEVCEAFYVLRDGKLVASGKFSEVSEGGVTELMIGRQLADEAFDDHINSSRDEVALKADHLSGEGFEDISFELHKGEILAITGLQGSGRDTLADTLFGALPFKGKLVINGTEIRTGANIRAFMKRGVAMVPRMRKERGIHNDLSINDNMYMAYLNTRFRGLLIDKKDMGKRFNREKQALYIKTDDPRNPITSLSGGNQQKIILGKWLEANADIILFDNPTQGIDVGTKFEIYHLILNLAQEGKAIIVFSAEYPEIYKVADSCMVLFKGKHNVTLRRDEITEKNVMYYSTGANLEGEKNGSIPA